MRAMYSTIQTGRSSGNILSVADGQRSGPPRKERRGNTIMMEERLYVRLCHCPMLIDST